MRTTFSLLFLLITLCIPFSIRGVSHADPYAPVQEAEKIAYEAYVKEVTATERRIRGRQAAVTRARQLQGKPAFMTDALWFSRLDEDENLQLRADRCKKYEKSLQLLKTYLTSAFPVAVSTPVYAQFLYKWAVFEFYSGKIEDATGTYLACLNNAGSENAMWLNEPLRDVVREGLAEARQEKERLEFVALVEVMRWAGNDPETAQAAKRAMDDFLQSNPGMALYLKEDSVGATEEHDVVGQAAEEKMLEARRVAAFREKSLQAKKRYANGAKP